MTAPTDHTIPPELVEREKVLSRFVIFLFGFPIDIIRAPPHVDCSEYYCSFFLWQPMPCHTFTLGAQVAITLAPDRPNELKCFNGMVRPI